MLISLPVWYQNAIIFCIKQMSENNHRCQSEAIMESERSGFLCSVKEPSSLWHPHCTCPPLRLFLKYLITWKGKGRQKAGNFTLRWHEKATNYCYMLGFLCHMKLKIQSLLTINILLCRKIAEVARRLFQFMQLHPQPLALNFGWANICSVQICGWTQDDFPFWRTLLSLHSFFILYCIFDTQAAFLVDWASKLWGTEMGEKVTLEIIADGESSAVHICHQNKEKKQLTPF